MKILAIDSASESVSVCLMDDHKIISEFFLNNKLTHSQTLLPMTKALMNACDLKIKDVDLFAVSTGPGSFTGVRIGVSMIKGLAFAENIPCVSVSTLEAMAYNFLHVDCIVCAALDARCKQVYNGMFEVKGGKVKRLSEDRAISVESLVSELKSYDEKIFLVGNGANLCYNELTPEFENVSLAPELLLHQRASCIAMIGKIKFAQGKFLSSHSLSPIYLRPSQAERQLESRGKKI